jgi:tRNA U34 5-methylaminomethyl-2-thiouridine-forming methyltransferase MnmC
MEIIQTNNNDQTIYHTGLDETYHSRHGAIAESQYVFIDNGLKRLKTESDSKIKIFEVGFGTGLNCLLAYKYAIQKNVQIIYHSIEAFPLDLGLVANLDYGINLDLNEEFNKIHRTEWNSLVEIDDYFHLKKINGNILEFSISENVYDIIFFDAFAKNKQPEIWDIGVITNMGNMLKSDGIFVTYAATGQLRRDLRQNNFEVENPAGAHYKRQMTVGVKRD